MRRPTSNTKATPASMIMLPMGVKSKSPKGTSPLSLSAAVTRTSGGGLLVMLVDAFVHRAEAIYESAGGDAGAAPGPVGEAGQPAGG